MSDVAAPLAEVLQEHSREFAQLAAAIAGSSVTRVSTDRLDVWRRFQEQNAERARQTLDSLRSIADGIWPWIKKTSKATGRKIAELYRRAAPPNWTTDPTTAVDDYGRARSTPSGRRGVPGSARTSAGTACDAVLANWRASSRRR